MTTSTALWVTVLLLLANAFFVGAEFAVMSARRSQVEPLVEAGKFGAKDALWALEHVSVMLACAQLGVTVASTGLGAVAEPALAHLFQEPLVALGLPAASSHAVAVVVALLIVVFFHVVVGEMIPKNLSIAMPEKAVLILGSALVKVAWILRPIVVGLDHLANFFLRLFGIEPKSEVAAAFTAEEVASIVEVSENEGVLQDDLGLLSGTLEFSEELVEDVMVAPESLVCVEPTVSAAQLERQVALTGYSRFPVCEENGELLGYLHLKDVLVVKEEDRDKPLKSWRIRPMPAVSPKDEIESALTSMQRSGVHLAQVVENNQTKGVIFLEDILEELIGEVRDSLHREETS